MRDEWNPLARPPKLGTPAFDGWFREHVAAFQKSRPDLPQGPVTTLSYKQRRETFGAYLRATNAAKMAQWAELAEPSCPDQMSRSDERHYAESALARVG